MRLVFVSLLLALAALTPAMAQQPPPALVVSLSDVSGAGVTGVAVVVTDRSGATVLARGTTGPDGTVRFGPLPAADVHVRVEGRLPGGVSLHLPGQDASGIALTLGAPGVQLDLRSEADGTVRPDPASISLEPGVPLDDVAISLLPTSPPAATAQPTTPALLTDAPPVADVPAPLATWLGLILFDSLLLGILGVLLLQRGGRHS